MIKNGVFLPPSQFEAWFLSSAISEKDMLVIEKAIDKSFQKIQKEQ
jgi:glutamate-1-semialdehyde 2,1-aminomutase